MNWKSSHEVHKMRIIDHHFKLLMINSIRGAWLRNVKRNYSTNKAKKKLRIHKKLFSVRIQHVLYHSKSSIFFFLSLIHPKSKQSIVRVNFLYLPLVKSNGPIVSDHRTEGGGRTIRGRILFLFFFLLSFSSMNGSILCMKNIGRNWKAKFVLLSF